MRLNRPVQARFHYGYPPPVNLATHRNSQAHSSKGTQSRHVPGGTKLLRLVSTRFQVLFHDPSPGCFSPFPHGTSPLSVTREYSGLGGGPPRFTRNFTGSVLLGNTLGSRAIVAYGTVTRYGGIFQNLPLATRFITPCQRGSTGQAVPRPRTRNARRLSHAYGLAILPFRSPLLRKSRLLSLPAGTEMFHFPAFPPHALCVQAWVTGHDSCRVSPFGHPRIHARLTAPRGISQPPTSFIGS
jgi:hypothetical protein